MDAESCPVTGRMPSRKDGILPEIGERLVILDTVSHYCRSVVALTNSAWRIALQSESPWSPTDVAWHESQMFVLEWTNPNDEVADGWRPPARASWRAIERSRRWPR